MIKQLTHIFPVNLNRALPLLALLGIFVLTGCDPIKYDDSMTNIEGENNALANCWGCTLFEALFNAINDMIKVLYVDMAGSAAGLMAIIFAFWIAYRVGKTFFTLKEPDTAEFWTDFTKMCFAVMFCGVILLNKETLLFFLSYTILPIFEGGLDFAIAIIDKSFEGIGVDTDYTRCHTGKFASSNSEDVLNEEFKFSISCMIYDIHQRLSYGMLFASKLLGIGFAEFFLGIFLYIIFFLLMLMFPLYMVDGIFNLGVMLILLPILIAFWPFQHLRHFAIAGWHMFISALVHIVIMAIFVVLIVEVFIDFTQMSTDTIDEKEEVVANIVSGPEAFLFTVFLGFYALLFMSRTNLLASQFANAKAPTNIFGKAAKLMAKTATNIARSVATSGAGNVIKAAGAIKGK